VLNCPSVNQNISRDLNGLKAEASGSSLKSFQNHLMNDNTVDHSDL